MKNAKDRRENSLLEPDFFDSQMLWVMLRHLRADRRRRVCWIQYQLHHNKIIIINII